MPANVETMFSVKLTPWHGLGVVIVEAPSIAEGIKLAGLDWDVEVQSLVRPDGVNVDDFAKAFVRKDNNSTLGVVGPNTHPLQNKHAFDFFQPFVDAQEAFLETAGSLDEGRKVWVMAKISRPNAEIVKGDEIAKFVLLSNSHDGTTAVRVGFTPIRVVCANTLAMAHGDKASKLLRVRHSKQVKENLDAIQETMNLANEEFEATAEQFRFLASRQINAKDLRNYVKFVFDMDEDESKLSTRSNNIVKEILQKHEQRTGMLLDAVRGIPDMATKEDSLLADVLAQTRIGQTQSALLDAVLDATTNNFEAGRGTENPASRGSYWTAYNAVNEYLNYNRGHTPDTRLNSLWFGQNAAANRSALEIAMEMANDGVAVKTV